MDDVLYIQKKWNSFFSSRPHLHWIFSDCYNIGLPGNHLHSLIKRFLGQDYIAGCGCESMKAKMNAWGPAGCREHLEEIVDKMMAEGTKRGWKLKIASKLPLARSVARKMVMMAIRKAETEQPLSNP